ncbi:MAG: hypothetical protein ACHQPH_27955 [Reyranellales bacterium]
MSRLVVMSSLACLVAGTVVGATIAYAAQPHMVGALENLRAARAQLERSTTNKGGHRERAIGAVDRAIEETRAGIAFAGG